MKPQTGVGWQSRKKMLGKSLPCGGDFSMLDFTVSFDKADFHHLAGLHKLRDNVRFQTGKQSDIMQEILEGRLTLSTAMQSVFFHEMEPRLSPLATLEHFLDSNEIIFRYNSKANIFSANQGRLSSPE